MMQRLLIIVEAVGIYGIALSLVWVWRLEWGAVAGWAWWLIPFTWIAAACLPGLWAPQNWLTWQTFCGRLSSVLWEVVRLSLLVFPAFGIAYLLYFSGEILPETGLPKLYRKGKSHIPQSDNTDMGSFIPDPLQD